LSIFPFINAITSTRRVTRFIPSRSFCRPSGNGRRIKFYLDRCWSANRSANVTRHLCDDDVCICSTHRAFALRRYACDKSMRHSSVAGETNRSFIEIKRASGRNVGEQSPQVITQHGVSYVSRRVNGSDAEHRRRSEIPICAGFVPQSVLLQRGKKAATPLCSVTRRLVV